MLAHLGANQPARPAGRLYVRRPMHVIDLLKQKGGTGATTVAIHLALAASETGRRVVIADTDPQASARS